MSARVVLKQSGCEIGNMLFGEIQRDVNSHTIAFSEMPSFAYSKYAALV